MIRRHAAASIVVVTLLVGACAGTGGASPSTAADAGNAGGAASPADGAASPAGDGDSVQVNLVAQNESGVSGTATITDLGTGSVRVEIDVEAGGNAAMPAHIHPGTCADLDPKPQFPLSDVENGKSTTEVDASLSDIQTGAFAVNLHESTEAIETYTACGDIPKA